MIAEQIDIVNRHRSDIIKVLCTHLDPASNWFLNKGYLTPNAKDIVFSERTNHAKAMRTLDHLVLADNGWLGLTTFLERHLNRDLARSLQLELKNELSRIPNQGFPRIQRETNDITPLNIMVVGRRGAGKSTLINALFGFDEAPTGAGRPVTQEIKKYHKPESFLNLYDTRGFEAADFNSGLRDVMAYINKLNKGDPAEHVHIVWYCVLESSKRVEAGDITVVNQLQKLNMPIVVVITQAWEETNMHEIVASELRVEPTRIIRVIAKEKKFKQFTIEPCGLIELVNITEEMIPEAQKFAFIAAQKSALDSKKIKCQAIVAAAAALAAAVAAAPIAFADAVLLVPVQVGMISSITAQFGLKLSKGVLLAICGSVVTGSLGTFTGRVLVTGLLKMIPGVGTAVGGVIAAGTASLLTGTFGAVYTAVLVELFEKSGRLPTNEEIVNAFNTAWALKVAGEKGK